MKRDVTDVEREQEGQQSPRNQNHGSARVLTGQSRFTEDHRPQIVPVRGGGVQALIFMLPRGLRGWQHDTENAALAKLALQLNTAGLMLDRPFGNGEAQAVAPLGAGAGFVHSIEPFENFLLM